MVKTEIEKKCNRASENFLIESTSNFKHYEYLPNWLVNKSIYLKKYRLEGQRLFKKYHRGSLVMIDFGVNVGNEISGNHFGIVLNKYDNPKNGVLTVIPVTSKKREYLIELDSLISVQSNITLRKLIIDDVLTHLAATEFIFETLDAESQRRHRFIIEKSAISMDDINKKIVSLGLNKLEQNKMSIETYEEIMRNSKSLQSKALKAIEVSEKYKKYNKISYAKPKDIQTISKYRIKMINDLDPCGKIKVSNTILDKIDKELINNITNM
ncbi:type II toxin-antitoxin system PemK/MazF family toxin [Listeria ivanovii subsp. londoniensis]|uniref:type II toxin-antitoxin system PemK/MazF family toxin n=1 Tax=Listeria ivanovii TaxID=1638 RepID=UPI001904DBA2|nr:type II toxin-antitoxin system PemK/MazF family toxin [Listeria ivanovii]ELU6316002.1 type II toxin-antitoxin system PemK/MazF family toxin [Listeria monocytogenes]MBK1994939.1 type II toxin-antitoxin system PemK/MazF family toxin [Listeria ivanovii subsp. londoniensis]